MPRKINGMEAAAYHRQWRREYREQLKERRPEAGPDAQRAGERRECPGFEECLEAAARQNRPAVRQNRPAVPCQGCKGVRLLCV